MRDYGKVHSSFWSSSTIRAMSDDGRLLALYLMTSNHTTILGAFRLPDGYACEDLGWSSGRVTKGFAELFANGFANRCETTKWVWICKHLQWNQPENPNQRKAAVKLAMQIPPECTWRADFVRDCAANLEMTPEQFPNPSATVPKPFLNQKQEQKQEQDQKQKARKRDLPVDFSISERVKVWATEHGHVDLEKRLEHFVSYAKRSGKQYADWDEAFMGAVRENWAKLEGAKAGQNVALDDWFAKSGHGGMQ